MEYSEYLKSKHWAKMRLVAYKFADYKCQLCFNGKDKLNVHHRTYRNLGHEKLSDLVVLCEDCHKIFHKKLALKDDSIDKPKMFPKTEYDERIAKNINKLSKARSEKSILKYLKEHDKLIKKRVKLFI